MCIVKEKENAKVKKKKKLNQFQEVSWCHFYQLSSYVIIQCHNPCHKHIFGPQTGLSNHKACRISGLGVSHATPQISLFSKDNYISFIWFFNSCCLPIIKTTTPKRSLEYSGSKICLKIGRKNKSTYTYFNASSVRSSGNNLPLELSYHLLWVSLILISRLLS